MPTVDVIVPLHNKAPFVEQALRSALGQTVQVRQVIVADDGSSDGGREHVARMATAEPRLVLINGPHGGPGASRNRAIARSSADFVAMLDADDFWAPDKLARQLPLFERAPEVGLVHCGCRLVDENGAPLRDQADVLPPAMRGNVFDEVRLGTYAVTGSASAVVVRRDVLMRAGPFDEVLRFGEDWDLWARIAQHAHFDHVSNPLAFIRMVSSTHSRTIPPEVAVMVSLRIIDRWRDDEAFMRLAVPVMRERIRREQMRMLGRPRLLLSGFPRLLRDSGTVLGPRLYPTNVEYLLALVHLLPRGAVAAGRRARLQVRRLVAGVMR